MALSKKSKKLIEYLVFSYLAIFPLGQIIRLRINLLGVSIPLHPLDVLAGLILGAFIIGKVRKPAFFKSIQAFLIVASFSLFLSIFDYNFVNSVSGALYFLRVAAHFSLIPVVWSTFNTKRKRNLIFKSLLAVCVFTAIFGLVQYLWLPDLRDLKYIGWDDHYYRLFGTFLDPTFTGIIITFGGLISYYLYALKKGKKYLLLMIFLLITLLLTYSRASYLAFIVGFSYLLLYLRRNVLKDLTILIALFLILLPFLPRDISEAAKLERTYSIFARVDNWKETLTIYKQEPLFGVGFNNICEARIKYLGEGVRESHACGGSDSSLLLVLATTGIVGFLVFFNMLISAAKSANLRPFSISFRACGLALLVHSQFSNSLFYPWVLGWLTILLATSIEFKEKSEE